MSFTDKDTSVNVSDISIGFVHGYSGGSASLFRWCLNNGTIADHSNVATSGTSILCEGIFIYPKTEDAFNRLFARYDIMVEVGSTASAYEPYQGTTYTTDLGRTVYGGTLEQVGGQLTDSMGYIASYNGETIGEPWISDRDEYVAGTTPSIGAEVVYTLATPQTYQLTPQTISLLHGNNNVWSDGEVELTYNADVGLYIDKKLGTSGTRALSMTRTLAKSETDDTKSVQLAEN